MELDNFWKQYNKMERKSFFRIGTGIVTTIALGACAYAQKQGWIDFTPNSSNTNPQSSEIDPTAISTKTGYERQKETLDSFLASKPEYAGREMFPINISFPLKGEPSDTVVIRSSEEEKADIGSYEYKFNGVELQPYTDAVVYTMKTDQNGKTSWVRLAGVYYPTADGSINTAWYYSADAFNKNVKAIDYNRKVFGFNSNDTNFVFWPLIEPPYSIDWATDLASKDVNDYTPWDGIEPFTLSMGVIQEPVGKALFAPAKIDTESPLPQGPISELQKTLGDKYKLSQEGDYFVISGIENLKFNQDGTAELAYGGEDLTIAFQAISAENEALQIGPWQNKDGNWTMLTSPAPKTVEDANSFPKLAYLEGHAKEKEIDLTIHKYVQMALAKSDIYDPLDEFKGVIVDGKEVGNEVPTYWQSLPGANKGTEFITLDDNHYNRLIALGQGYASLAVYDVSGKQKLDLKIIPIIDRDTDGSISSMVGLVDQNYFSKIMELGLMTNEKRTNTGILLPTTDTGKEPEVLFASIGLLEFAASSNQELLTKDVIKTDMDKLPQMELGTMGFWVFEIWN